MGCLAKYDHDFSGPLNNFTLDDGTVMTNVAFNALSMEDQDALNIVKVEGACDKCGMGSDEWMLLPEPDEEADA